MSSGHDQSDVRLVLPFTYIAPSACTLLSNASRALATLARASESPDLTSIRQPFAARNYTRHTKKHTQPALPAHSPAKKKEYQKKMAEKMDGVVMGGINIIDPSKYPVPIET